MRTAAAPWSWSRPRARGSTSPPTAFRYERPDVVQFYAARAGTARATTASPPTSSCPRPSLLSAGWIAELHTSGGMQVEIRCPAVTDDAAAVRAAILGELASRGPIGGPLAERPRPPRADPAAAADRRRIAGRTRSTTTASRRAADGLDRRASVQAPRLHRASAAALLPRPRLRRVELVYVLDSTEQSDELAAKARELFALYGLPFRVVNLTSGGGFAAANNHGIAVSRAKRLLLLNSDVIPDRPGWSGTLSAFYDAAERIGALGPKLLYEDDSLQHAGLYFHGRPARRSGRTRTASRACTAASGRRTSRARSRR